MRVCPKCKEEKERESFSVCKNSGDGLQVYCKACVVHIRRAYDQTEAGRAAKKRFRQSPKGKAGEKRRHNNHRVLARREVFKATKRGEIPSAEARGCSMGCKSKAEYHHPDYSRPMWVVPLCFKCHRRLHRSALSA